MTLLQVENATVICQRALGLAEHRNFFTSLEDGSDIAREARLRYDARRRAVLEALDWRFARRRVIAQSVTVPAYPYGLDAAWQRPPECIRIRGVWDGRTLLPHQLEEVIFTPAATAPQIVYTGDFFDATRFPPIFTSALEYLLAAEFAMVYARSVNRMEIMLNLFRQTLEQADAFEATERSETAAFAEGDWVATITSGFCGGAA